MSGLSNGPIRVRRYKEFGNLEMIRAVDVVHFLPRHMHQTVCIGIVDSGARACLHRGTNHIIVPGQVLVLNAGEVHTCGSAAGRPYSYRMVCLPGDFLRDVLKDATSRPTGFFACGACVVHDGELCQLVDQLTRTLYGPASILEQEAAVYSFAAYLHRLDSPLRDGEQSQ